MAIFFFFFFNKGGKCGELHLKALLSWFVELWSRKRAATSAVGDGTEHPKRNGEMGLGGRRTLARSGPQHPSTLFTTRKSS